MTKPDLKDSFIYEGNHIDIDWYDVDSHQALPDLPWQQVYVVGNLDGKVPVVYYPSGHMGLPGGHTESGETVHETITREVTEELNCELIDWIPIGYQTLHQAGKADIHQLRIYGNLKRIGDFVSDPGGSVIGHHLIDLTDLNSMVKWGITGQRIQDIAAKRWS